MKNRILFVDDEAVVLEIATLMLGEFYRVDTARTGEEGLEAIKHRSSYSAIVSDLCMPGMDGATFLKRASEISPQSPRLAVTGYTDLQYACDAINEAKVFRLLPKPCDMTTLRAALDDAIAESDRLQFHQACLDQVSDGYVGLLANLLTSVDSYAHDRAMRVAKIAQNVANSLALTNAGDFQSAAISYEIEALVASDKNWNLKTANETLSLLPGKRATTRRADTKHPVPTKSLPRSAQPECAGGITSESILRVVHDLDLLMEESILPAVALQRMSQQPDQYDRRVIQSVRVVMGWPEKAQSEKRSLADVCPGMVLMQDVVSTDGRTLVARDTKLTESMLTRLRKFASNSSIDNHVLVGDGHACES